MKILLTMFSIFFCTSFVGIQSNEASEIAEKINNRKFEKVTVCQIKNDPAKYNHKLLEVEALISFSFENFTLDELNCDSEQGIWLEYGGVSSSGTIICCNVVAKRSRTEPLIVEKIPVPLVADAKFRELDNYLQKSSDTNVKATIRGRFFAGKKSKSASGGEGWYGYGHFGSFSLFAIEQVVSFEKNDNPLLDYSNSLLNYESEWTSISFGYFDFKDDPITLQKNADAGNRTWSFDDPKRVAIEGLALRLGISIKEIKSLKKSQEKQGQIAYSWKPNDETKEYWIVVSRPFYLSNYAKDSSKIVWSVIEALEANSN